jgi:hypothetical protein
LVAWLNPRILHPAEGTPQFTLDIHGDDFAFHQGIQFLGRYANAFATTPSLPKHGITIQRVYSLVDNRYSTVSVYAHVIT